MTLEPGLRLGRYDIVAPIGKGGMGEVYSATDTRLKRAVAIKVLPADVADDPMRLRRFAAEAEAVAQLNHPNILAIYDVGSDQGIEFLVTELLDGESLRSRLRNRPFPPATAAEYASKIARGLAAAHAQGIVHRDIKPENIFITADGRVKLLDFGLARSDPARTDHDAPTEVVLTAPGSTLGTVGYASPEQLRGERVDARTDIFSLGAVMYEMLTGKQPFRKETSVATVAAVLTEEPPDLALLRDQAPALAPVVVRCLAKRAEERFQSADDLAFAIETAFNPRQVHSSQAVRTWRSRAMIAATIALVAIASGVGAWLLRGRNATRTPQSVAVLPFRPLVPNDAEAYLGLGLADAVISKLSSVSALRVRPTSAVRRFVTASVDPLQAGSQLGVDSVLDGTFQRSGDRLRVTVNLLRINDGSSLWADTLDVRSGDIFSLEDQLSNTVTEKMRVRLTPTERRQVEKRYTKNPAAYDAYLRGAFALDKRVTGGEAVIREAMGWFQKAIELDPGYALAYAQLGYSHALMGIYLNPAPEWVRSARALLARAEQLDPKLAQVYVARSEIQCSLWGNYDLDGAIRELLIAQQLEPNVGHAELGGVFFHLGLKGPALRELEIARRNDPLSEYVKIGIVATYLYSGDFTGADEVGRRLLGISDIETELKLVSLAGTNRKARLDALGRRFAEPAPATVGAAYGRAGPGDHALYEALIGNLDQAKREIESDARQHQNSRLYHHVAHRAACIYAIAGDAPSAVRWLQQMVQTGFPDYPLIMSDPQLASIRNDPEFRQLTERLKVRWEAANSRFSGAE